MPKNITVYTRLTCGPCNALKTYLKNKGINYNEIDVDQTPSAQNLIQQLSGYSMVPLTVITKEDDSQEIVTGFNLSKLTSAIK